MKRLILLAIKIYQKIFSPDQGILFRSAYGTCRFHPSCSEYLYQAISKYGISKGVFLGLKRIGKCHPWHEGGFDPVK